MFYYVFNSNLPITSIVISICICNIIKFIIFLLFSKKNLVYIYIYSEFQNGTPILVGIKIYHSFD